MKIEDYQNHIDSQKLLLKRYSSLLELNPESTFYQGLVKNTEEHIKELEDRLKIYELD